MHAQLRQIMAKKYKRAKISTTTSEELGAESRLSCIAPVHNVT